MAYFSQVEAASRYAAARPYFHPRIVESVRRLCRISQCDAALDVGCGTGQSTAPLTELARQVVGIDVSPAMLGHALQHQQVSYVQAAAEALPWPDRSFDLLTVGLALHWLDRPRFLREAGRVLRPAGWLVVYNDSFGGRMAENPAFAQWFRGQYSPRYPAPARDSSPLTEASLATAGFASPLREDYERATVFSCASLVEYLLTQSNLLAAAAAGRETLDEIRRWLQGQVAPLFPQPRGTFAFAGTVQACGKQG